MTEPRTACTTSAPHCMREGDIIEISLDGGWLSRLVGLIRRPRVKAVGRVLTPCSFEIIERRMTWREWRRAWLRAVGL